MPLFAIFFIYIKLVVNVCWNLALSNFYLLIQYLWNVGLWFCTRQVLVSVTLKENSLLQIPGPVTLYSSIVRGEVLVAYLLCSPASNVCPSLRFWGLPMLCAAYSQFKDVGVKLLIHSSQLVFVADEQYLSFTLFFSLSFPNTLYIAMVSIFTFTEIISLV